MRTKTFIAVALGVALAVLAGVAIWAMTGDDSDRRLGVVEQVPAGAAGTQMTSIGVNGTPFAVNAYTVGGAQQIDAATRQPMGVRWSPLEFTRPLDELASTFFQRATQGLAENTVKLEVLRSIGGKVQAAVKYDFAQALYASGDEAAAGTNKAEHALQLVYGTPTITVFKDVGFAPAGGPGKLEIPNVTDSTKPAYVSAYSWGWSVPVAAEGTKSGAATPEFKSLTIQRPLDLHAAWFWQALANSQAIPQMTLSLEGPDPKGGKQIVYASYKLSDVLVAEVQDSGNSNQLAQQIKLSFSGIQMSHAPRSASYNLKS